jgi:hypothetical protein
MPGFEYDTIVTKVDGVGEKIDNEIVNKKFQSGELNAPMDNMSAIIAPLLGMFASTGVTSIAMPMPGNPGASIGFEAAGALGGALEALGNGANAFKGAASGMINGGIRSLLNFGKAVLPLVGQVVAVLVAFGAVAFEIWYTFDQIGQTVSYLYEAKAELEVKVGALENKTNRIEAENRALKAGLAKLEKSTRERIYQQAIRIQDLEAEVSNIATLIINNHAESMSKVNSIGTNVAATKTAVTDMSGNVSAIQTDTFNIRIDLNNGVGMLSRDIGTLNSVFNTKLTSIETKQTTFEEYSKEQWNDNAWWQTNNRAAVVATLTTAAVEAPGRPLDLIKRDVITTKEKLEKATEGVPSVGAADRDYTAAIAGGTAVAAGTIGYATWKGMNGGFKDVKKKLGSMINVGEIMQALTLITTFHNAINLSRDIGVTLFSVVDNSMNLVLKGMGVENADGEELSTSKSVGQFLDNTMKTIFGVQLWTEIKADWAAANRIVSAGNTLLWSIRELGDNVGTLATLACENTGKLGNSLRKSGVIFSDGPWFPENYTRGNTWGVRMTNFLENVQNTAEVFEQLTSTTLSIQQNVTDIRENNEKFQKTLKEDLPKLTENNKPISDDAIASALASIGTEIELEHLKNQDE